MDDLFNKAVDVLAPLQSQALSALDSTLNEYPGEEVLQTYTSSEVQLKSMESVGFAPSTIDAVKNVLNFWEELDLEGRKEKLDEQGVSIAQLQEGSMKNRKVLAEQTKAFKEGDKKDFAKLLKSYQSEIDSLTKRAKFAEASYLGIYQLLYDAPDVVPSLRAFVDTVDRVSEAEQETRRCRQELEVVKRELAASKPLLSNVRRLEERNAVLEEEMDSRVDSAVEEKMREMIKEKEAVEAREASLLSVLDEMKDSFSALQKQHDTAQSRIFDLETKVEEERTSKQIELESSAEEIDLAQERVKALEHVCRELTSELEKLRLTKLEEESARVDMSADTGEDSRNGTKSFMSPMDEMEASLSSKDKFISTLHDQIQQMQAETKAKTDKFEAVLRDLEAELEARQEACDLLEAELATRPTNDKLEELKKQNRILQELVGTDVDESWDLTKSDLADSGSDSEAVRVQLALRQCNRKLTSELTSAKMALSKREAELEDALSRALSLEEKNLELTELVGKLEEDLVKGSGMISSRGEAPSSHTIGGLLSERKQSSGDSFPFLPKVASEGEKMDEEDDMSHSMLEIVCGQRERFRKRVKELEEENGRLNDSLGRSSAEAKRLQEDNISLYEKIKFLEQYNRKSTVKRVGGPQSGSDVVVFGGSSGQKNSRYACFGVSDPGGFDSAVTAQESQLSSSGGAEMRYRKLYEEKMNPFNEFHAKEQDRSYRNLRLHDKITLTGGRFLLSNKYGRIFVFFYTLLLHFFVFLILYRSTYPNTVIVESVSGRDIYPTTLNSTLNLETPSNSSHTFSDTLAEKVGTMIQATRDFTNQGSKIRNDVELSKIKASENTTATRGEAADLAKFRISKELEESAITQNRANRTELGHLPAGTRRRRRRRARKPGI